MKADQFDFLVSSLNWSQRLMEFIRLNFFSYDHQAIVAQPVFDIVMEYRDKLSLHLKDLTCFDLAEKVDSLEMNL